MKRLNKYLPLAVPLAIFFALEVYFFYHKLIYPASAFIVIVIIFSLWSFTKESQTSKQWWNFAILPALFTLAVISYSTLLENKPLIQLLFLFDLFFLYFYFRFSYYYLVKPIAYKVSAIENLSSYVNFLSYFLIISTIYGLQSYLNIPVWQLMVVLAVVSILAVHQIMWANKIESKTSNLYLILITLALIEIGWAISFLPLNFNISGLILAICYYVIIGLARLYLLEILDKEKIRLYLIFGIVSLFLVLLTARWL